ALGVLADHRRHLGDEQQHAGFLSQHARSQVGTFAIGDDRYVDQAAGFAQRRLRYRHDRVGIEALFLRREAAHDELLPVQILHVRVANIVARIIGLVGLVVHAVHYDFGVRTRDLAEMRLQRGRIRRQMAEYGEALVPDFHAHDVLSYAW